MLALMAEGLGNAAIAERLVVSDGAVHKHIRNIFAKLDLPPPTAPTAGSRPSCTSWRTPAAAADPARPPGGFRRTFVRRTR